MLPKSIGEALTALRADESFRTGFGSAFVDYYAHIKNAERERYEKDEPAQDHGTVTAWEQKEYLDLF